jgi:ankyrin repeat protein
MKKLAALFFLCVSSGVYSQSFEESFMKLNEIPIFRAISGGNLQQVRGLINSGVDVNLVSSVYLEPINMEMEVTPLSSAITSVRWDIARYLISAGADINRQTMLVNYNQDNQISYNTVLSTAATSTDPGAENFIDYLLSLNPVIRVWDIQMLAQTGRWRFVNLAINRVPMEEKENAVVNGILATLTNAYMNGKVLSARHINCVKLLLNQATSLSEYGKQYLRNIQQILSQLSDNNYKNEFYNLLNSAINN